MMDNQEAIMRIKEHIRIHQICEPRAIKISEALDMAISALQAQDIPDTNVGDMISRQAAIDGLECHYIERINLNDWQSGWNAAIDWMKDVYLDELPSAQPEPLLDEIVDEIRKTIAETESNGKYHADFVRHNGEMICHGLQIALSIIEEKRNERSD